VLLDAQFRQRDHVPRQRASRERAARTKVCLRPDANVTLQSSGDLLRVRANLLAEPGNFVDEGDAGCKKGIERVLHHLRRFGAHEKQLRRERLEELGEQRPLHIAANTDDHTLGFLEGIEGAAEAKVFRRAGEVKLRELPLQRGACAHGQLRRDQHQRAGRQMRQATTKLLQHELDVRFVMVIDRRIVTEPEHVGIGTR
jgi:hypothetical protein